MEILTPEQQESIVYIEQDFCRGAVNVLYTEDLRRFLAMERTSIWDTHQFNLYFLKFIATKRRPHPIMEIEASRKPDDPKERYIAIASENLYLALKGLEIWFGTEDPEKLIGAREVPYPLARLLRQNLTIEEKAEALCRFSTLCMQGFMMKKPPNYACRVIDFDPDHPALTTLKKIILKEEENTQLPSFSYTGSKALCPDCCSPIVGKPLLYY